VGSEDVESGKPNPECYLKGAKLLGATPERCVVVEDTPAGIEAACAAGMKTIAVTTTHWASELSEADAIVRALSDVSVERRDASGKDKPYLELLVET
jgi:sugar-phosphatase